MNAPSQIAFTELVTTQMSGHGGETRLIVGADAANQSEIARLVPGATAPAGRTLVAALQGQQRTGGYAIRIGAIERHGSRLVVRATFTVPARDAIVIQVLTSPAHVVTVASSDVSGVREAVLLDDSGTERARPSVP